MSKRVAVKPINVWQFAGTLRQTWQKPNKLVKWMSPLRIGLAISGGVDSMALATLTAEFQKKNMRLAFVDKVKVRFRAFIVDHGARPRSDVEAKNVAKNLRKMGIPSTILKVQMPKSSAENQFRLSNFETTARTLRYRALGHACRCFRIKSLLLAHHQDDQAETVLLRILNSSTGAGLAGMRSVAQIPECYGMYGVYQSDPGHQHNPKKIEVVEGGIKIYRPLLGNTKEQLVQTCKSSRTEWFEDFTNRDVRLTTRNTIRSLLRSDRLPLALRTKSLLQVSEYWSKERAERERLAIFALKQIQKSLDIRSGVLQVTIPHKQEWLNLLPKMHARTALVMAESLANMVSPLESIEKDRLLPIRDIFKEPVHGGSEPLTTSTMTFAHIHCKYSHTDSGRRLILSRQPFATRGQSKQPECIWTLALTSASRKLGASSELYGTWQLWDGRYWLRVTHRTRKWLIARPLQEEDIHSLRQKDPKEWAWASEALGTVAPGMVRFTIPAICDETGREVLALPTIGYSSERKGFLKYEIKYKNIGVPLDEMDMKTGVDFGPKYPNHRPSKPARYDS